MLFRTIAGLSLLGSAAIFAFRDMALILLPVLFVGLYAGLCLLALAFLCIVCAMVDLDKPQGPDDPFYRKVMYLYIEALITLVRCRLHTKGLENTPREGRFLLVCNHLDLPDPGILLHCFKKSQLAFITKKENYQMPIINKFMHKISCQPLDRENDRAALKTILKCIQMLKEDRVSIGVFPEGYCSLDGRVRHFRPGVFKIAQKTKVPIVVCTIQNSHKILKNIPKGKATDVELHLVRVIAPEEYAEMDTTQISDLVYETMISDLGEDFRALPT